MSRQFGDPSGSDSIPEEPSVQDMKGDKSSGISQSILFWDPQGSDSIPEEPSELFRN